MATARALGIKFTSRGMEAYDRCCTRYIRRPQQDRGSVPCCCPSVRPEAWWLVQLKGIVAKKIDRPSRTATDRRRWTVGQRPTTDASKAAPWQRSPATSIRDWSATWAEEEKEAHGWWQRTNNYVGWSASCPASDWRAVQVQVAVEGPLSYFCVPNNVPSNKCPEYPYLVRCIHAMACIKKLDWP